MSNKTKNTELSKSFNKAYNSILDKSEGKEKIDVVLKNISAFKSNVESYYKDDKNLNDVIKKIDEAEMLIKENNPEMNDWASTLFIDIGLSMFDGFERYILFKY